jgi:hypothetical protein
MMTVQLFLNKKDNTTITISKSHKLTQEQLKIFELIGEFEGEDWNECCIKANEKLLEVQKKYSQD